MDYANATTAPATAINGNEKTKRTERISLNTSTLSNNSNHNKHHQHRKAHNHHHHHHNHHHVHHQPNTKANRVKKSGNGAAATILTHRVASELPLRERKPNIILILTDDQDVELGKY